MPIVNLQLISIIALSIVGCMGLFTMGFIIGLKAQKDKLPKVNLPQMVEKTVDNATTTLEKRIEQLRSAPSEMKFNPYYKGIYVKETV